METEIESRDAVATPLHAEPVEAANETASEQADEDVKIEASEAQNVNEYMQESIQEDGKRVKVYELREQSWHDRGTGHCKGIYDDTQDLALLVVEAEDTTDKEEGGFLKEELLLSAKVEREDIYARQQDTLIVWTEPGGPDIALSFQDAEGCEDIWQFITEVQRHLNNLPSDADAIPGTSSPLSGSPVLSMAVVGNDARSPWQPPTLQNIREHSQMLLMQQRSVQGRERVVEHILTEDYIKNLINVFEQAEDLESLDDLHIVCAIMQTIVMLNDNGIFEYILQDGIFESVIGIFEYDREFPQLKASFRQLFREISKFRQVVEIKDVSIRNKIHQTYRLQFLKEVVLARILDDPTFSILNGFIFFNQVDIVGHIQANGAILAELFANFNNADASDERKLDTVLFLHQLVIMGKAIQLPNRLALYRNLLERDILAVLAWALKRREAPIVHAAAEVLTILGENDSLNLRKWAVADHEAKKERTLVTEIIDLHGRTSNTGLLSQLTDLMRTLLEPPAENDSFIRRDTQPEALLNYFYDNCCGDLFKPLLDLPEITHNSSVKLDRRTATVTQHLIELLYFCVTNHTHRASYYVLSNPVSKKIMSLLYLRDKPLRLVVLRYLKSCLKVPNHFLHRSFVKQDLFAPLITLLEEESRRDNMLTSACMTIVDEVRKDNIKPIINYLFETYRARLDALSKRPFFKASIQALHLRWEQINEPPPPPPPQDVEASNHLSREDTSMDDYFNASDDEKASPPSTKRKRTQAAITPNKRKSPKSGPAKIGQSALGLDYDDASDSDGGSPRQVKKDVNIDAKPELAEELGDVAEQMRQKRMREDDEEEGFGLVAKKPNDGPKSASPTAASTKADDKAADKKEKDEGGTKVKLSWSALKRFGSGKIKSATSSSTTAAPSAPASEAKSEVKEDA